jgi:hypothetical protein
MLDQVTEKLGDYFAKPYNKIAFNTSYLSSYRSTQNNDMMFTVLVTRTHVKGQVDSRRL